MASNDPNAALTSFVFLFFGGCACFMMQVGFMLIETGSVHSKNTKNVMTKNLMDAAICALVWVSVGHSFAFADGGSAAFGDTSHQALLHSDMGPDPTPSYALVFFQFNFASAAVTIVSGSITERVRFQAYAVFSLLFTGFVYPVVARWVWSSPGWLSSGSWTVLDVAGGGVVHVSGGMAALVGATIVGPRQGRFVGGRAQPMPQQNVVLQTLGMFLLWWGWFAFNTASVIENEHRPMGRQVAMPHAAINTLIAPASSCLATVLMMLRFDGHCDIVVVNNAVLAGAAAITAPCSLVQTWAAIIIGVIAAVIFRFACALLVRKGIDDVIFAAPVHLFCGGWGVIATGLFTDPKMWDIQYGQNKSDDDQSVERLCGLFYGCGNGARQLGLQIFFLLATIVWVGATSYLIFATLRRYKWLRVPHEVEKEGMDVTIHGGEAHQIHAVMAFPSFGLDEMGPTANSLNSPDAEPTPMPMEGVLAELGMDAGSGGKTVVPDSTTHA